MENIKIIFYHLLTPFMYTASECPIVYKNEIPVDFNILLIPNF